MLPGYVVLCTIPRLCDRGVFCEPVSRSRNTACGHYGSVFIHDPASPARPGLSSQIRSSMNSRVSLTTLDEDILLIIVGLVSLCNLTFGSTDNVKIHLESSQYLRAFSRASRFCKRLSDPLLYRSLVLSDDLVRINSSRYMLQKLRELTNDIRHHIRHLKISNKKRDGQCQGIFENSSDEGCLDLLGEALRSLTHLKSFRYATSLRSSTSGWAVVGPHGL